MLNRDQKIHFGPNDIFIEQLFHFDIVCFVEHVKERVHLRMKRT